MLRSRSSMRSFSQADGPPMAMAMMEDAADMDVAPASAGVQLKRETLGSTFLKEGGDSSFDAASVKTMLVRTGNVEAETSRDLEPLAARVEATVAEIDGAFVEKRSSNGGYIVREPVVLPAPRGKKGKKHKKGKEGKDATKRRQGQSISLTIRVPVGSFFWLVDALRGRAARGDPAIPEGFEAAVAGIFAADEVTASDDRVEDVS